MGIDLLIHESNRDGTNSSSSEGDPRNKRRMIDIPLHSNVYCNAIKWCRSSEESPGRHTRAR